MEVGSQTPSAYESTEDYFSIQCVTRHIFICTTFTTMKKKQQIKTSYTILKSLVECHTCLCV